MRIDKSPNTQPIPRPIQAKQEGSGKPTTEQVKEAMIQDVMRDSRNYHNLPEKYQNDRDIVLALIENHPFAAEWIDTSLLNDPEIAIKAAEGYPATIRLLPAGHPQLNNPEVILAAVRQPLYGSMLEYASDEVKDNPKVVKAAVIVAPYCIQFASDRLRSDLIIVRESVNILGSGLPWADPSFRENRQFLLQVVSRNPEVVTEMSEELYSNEEFLWQLIDTDWEAYELLRNDERVPADFFQSTRARHFESERFSILEKFAEYDIDVANRFQNMTVAREILANRMGMSETSDQRPVALIVYPKEDHNAHYERNNQIAELMARGYRVVYHEATDEEDFFQAIEDTGSQKQISALIIGGHGTPQTVNFSSTAPYTGEDRETLTNEEYFLDISDKQQLLDRDLSSYLTEDSIIVLESCSTGRGGMQANNVITMLQEAFPQSRGFAPQISTRVMEYNYDQNNRITFVDFLCGPERTTTY